MLMVLTLILVQCKRVGTMYFQIYLGNKKWEYAYFKRWEKQTKRHWKQAKPVGNVLIK